MKVSIVMATHNRRQLLINTLKSIEYYNKDRDVEVIVVDDNSSPAESILDVPDLFKIPVIVIPITKEEKNWMCCCIPFNIGFSFASGDIIIIQNPENLHIGDIVDYAIKNITDKIFLSFALYSMDYPDSNNLINNGINKGKFSGEDLKKVIGKFVGKIESWTDGMTCWYNHSIHQPSGCHLISAITRKSLEDLNGFDERYGPGFAYDDMEFRERIKRKGMIIKIIDYPLAVHQRHELARYKENNVEFRRNGDMYVDITMREKIFRAPKNVFYNPQKVADRANHVFIEECPISNTTDPVTFFDLGEVPLVNNLCKTREESLSCKKFPLAVQIFEKSRLTCLTEIVNKDSLFLNYVYQSGVSKPYLDHCSEMYDYLASLIGFNKGDYVFDIGGNDGSLLLQFKKKNDQIKLINIDASNSFIEINKKAGITYVNKFFDEKFQLTGKRAHFIISTNVFQHTAPIRSFVQGVFKNLDENGVWCLEFPYLLTTILNDNYDQVYHEHVYYFILKNIIDLLKQEGMRVFHVSFHNIHAGTLRVLSVKATSGIKSDLTIQSFLNLESSLAPDYLSRWGERMQLKIRKFYSFIDSLIKEKKVIIGFGAAAKGCVFLNSIGVDYKTIPYIIDDTPFKQGQFMPGTGIQIVDRSILSKTKVDYILILAHNFQEHIVASLPEYKGKFIVMFPDIHII